MTQSQFRFARLVQPPQRPRGAGLGASLAWLGGLIAAGIAMTIGAILAVFTAAAVAVIAVVASVLFFITGFAVRARRSARAKAAAGADDVIEARKVGETWVAYGWERQGR